MKYDLEDLLKESFSHKEKPTQEFCQSVIREMKAKEKRPSPTGWMRNKGFIAAACIGMILLAGVAFRVWKMGFVTEKGQSTGQFAQTQTLSPAMTNLPKNTDNPAGEKGQSVSRYLPGNEKRSDGEGNENANREKNGDDHDAAGNPSEQEIRKKPNGNAGITPLPDSNGHSGGGSKKPGDSPVPENPVSDEPQVEPVEQTPQPDQMPDATLIPEPSGGYVSLCSIADYTFTKSEITEGDIVSIESTSLLRNQMISSYEQLQELLQKVKEKPEYQYNGAQQVIQRLNEFDSNYFVSNALCLYTIDLPAGYEFKLTAVDVEEDMQGRKWLSIQIAKSHIASMEADGADGQGFYGCSIQVPKSIAQYCEYMACEVT